MKAPRLLLFGLWNHLAALQAGTVSVSHVGEALGEIGMADMEQATVVARIRDDEVTRPRARPLGLDLGLSHRAKSMLAGAAFEVGWILPLAAGHDSSLTLEIPTKKT
jgi:hypothetical protein